MLQKEAVESQVLELLKELQSDELFSGFHLAGGTGLALHLGHRRSADIDLFSLADFDSGSYLEYLEKKFGFIQDFNDRSTLKGSIGEVKTDFISHPYELIRPVEEAEGIRLYSIPDIAAMKVNAVAGNDTRSKDFVDLFFLLESYSVHQILGFYSTKYRDRNTFHALKSLSFFDEVDLSDWPVLLGSENLSWEMVKKTITDRCKVYVKEELGGWAHPLG